MSDDPSHGSRHRGESVEGLTGDLDLGDAQVDPETVGIGAAVASQWKRWLVTLGGGFFLLIAFYLDTTGVFDEVLFAVITGILFLFAVAGVLTQLRILRS